MMNLTKTTIESLSIVEEALLQEKIEKHKERMQTTMESGKPHRRPQCLRLIKKDRSLRRQEKSSKEIKGPHLKCKHKTKSMGCLRRLISLHHQQKKKR
jgi:hypothetical protein